MSVLVSAVLMLANVCPAVKQIAYLSTYFNGIKPSYKIIDLYFFFKNSVLKKGFQVYSNLPEGG